MTIDEIRTLFEKEKLCRFPIFKFNKRKYGHMGNCWIMLPDNVPHPDCHKKEKVPCFGMSLPLKWWRRFAQEAPPYSQYFLMDENTKFVKATLERAYGGNFNCFVPAEDLDFTGKYTKRMFSRWFPDCKKWLRKIREGCQIEEKEPICKVCGRTAEGHLHKMIYYGDSSNLPISDRKSIVYGNCLSQKG